nr:putative ribonuclease H-like domain-containing protein [Tanacetum cinerariifolium]
MTLPNPQKHVVPIVVLTKSKLVPITPVRPVTIAVLNPHVTRPRQAKTVVTKPHSPPRRHINRGPSPNASNFSPKVTTAKASMVNAVKGVQGKWEWKPKCPILDHMCDKKNSILFTDTECLVLSPEFKLPDENQVLLRVPRENNMYNVDLKNIAPSGYLTYLFAKATLDESNLWHRRLGHINFKTMNKLVKDPLSKFDGKVDEGFLVGYSNTDGDAAFEVKEPEFEGRKPQSEVHVSLSNSAQAKKHDDKSKREAKGKSPVESSTRYRNLSAEFEDFSDNSINEVSTAGSLVPAVGQISTNSTNTFSVAGPSNTAVSLTHGKSSYMDTSQLPDDPNMPELEDITYSDDKEDIGAEADFTNLETTIIVSPIPTIRVYKDHPVTQIIGNLSSATQTRSMTRVAKDQGGLSQINNDDFHTFMFTYFLLQEEPKRVHQALKDLSSIKAMQEELLQFKMQKVWVLVDFPNGKRAIGTKWVFRNKKDERGIVVRNKARLVAQGHTQEEGIDYEEVFAPVARIEAIRLFLAYASFMGFMVYQINVKSALLYETIKEEVYVCQPLGFEDPDYHDKVYKVVKALYGLHQAPRAWYETLANYLLENGFQKGKIDQTLFIKRQKDDILLVQIYVDDIIFGHTNKDLCKAFEKLIKDKFQMSSMGELTFFLGLQVKQKQDGIFISQDKYVAEILRKFGLTDGKSASTPIDTEKPLLKDPDGEDVDVHTYRSWIGSLMYLTSSRPGIMFETSVLVKKVNDVTRLQALVDKKKVIITEATITDALRLNDAESIDCLPNEEIFTELSRMRTSWNEFSSSIASANICLPTSRKFNFSKYIFDSLVRNVDSSTKFCMYPRFLQLMIRVQLGDLSSHSTKYSSPALTQKVFANMRRVGKGFSGVDTPLFEGMIVAQQADEGAADVNVDNVPAAGVADEGAASVGVDDVPTAIDEPSIPSPTPPTQPPPPSQDLPSTSQVHPTPPLSLIAQPPSPQQQQQSLQDAKILMDLLHTLLETCTTLTRRAEHLEQDKIAQALEITKIKQRVKKLERRNKLRVSKLRRLKKGRIIANMDANKDITLKDVADIAKEDDEIVPAELQEVMEVVTTAKLMTEVVTAASATITVDDTLILAATITAATPTLSTAPSAARRRKRVVIRDPKGTATPSTIIHTELKSKDKGKGIMVHESKPLKKKTQIEQEAYTRELEAKLNKNIDWDNVIEQVQRKEKEDNAKFHSNVAFLEKTKEQMEEEDSRALKRKVKSSEDKAAKKLKLDEEEIYTENKKPYYKIKRADGTHQLYLSFLSMLRNFNREDLEILWKLVKERFSSSKPKNFLDDFLLTILGAMFEKPDIQAQIWRNQISVHGLSKRKYPLTRFTLDQMLNNVTLEVEEESEVSLELLRFIRQQQQEGFRLE